MADKLTPRTALDRGPPGEEPIELDSRDPETLAEAGGDTAGSDIDSNVGGAPATRGMDSGGAVGVRRGRAVGRAGFEFDDTERGETDQHVEYLDEASAGDVHLPGPGREDTESYPGGK